MHLVEVEQPLSFGTQPRGACFVDRHLIEGRCPRHGAHLHRDPRKEYWTHFRLGVDGVFSDAPDTALFAWDLLIFRD